jgi:WD40 repeat protein
MGWDFTHLTESIIGDVCLKPITLAWILTELLHFLIFNIIKAVVLLSSTENSWACSPVDSYCFNIILYIFQLLKGHDDHVITCLEFCGTRVVSGSDDNTLKVWSALTGKVRNSVCIYIDMYKFCLEFSCNDSPGNVKY